jgi:hypothetical protein
VSYPHAKLLFVFNRATSLLHNDENVPGGIIWNIECDDFNLRRALDVDAMNMFRDVRVRLFNDAHDSLNVSIAKLAAHNERPTSGGRGSRDTKQGHKIW